ncbi:hypothetical protein CAJAP_06685 [Camponotus japonicus]
MARLIVLSLLFVAVCIYDLDGYPSKPECGPNEEWHPCAVLEHCEPKCGQVFRTLCPAICFPRCQCLGGYKRNVTTNLCVECF